MCTFCCVFCLSFFSFLVAGRQGLYFFLCPKRFYHDNFKPIFTILRFIEGLVESNSKKETKQGLLPRLLQRKANRGETQKSLVSDGVRGGKRGASIGLNPGENGWVRKMFGSPEEVQEVLLGFVNNNTRSTESEKKGNTLNKEIDNLEKGMSGDTIRSTQAPKYQIVYKNTLDDKSIRNKVDDDKSQPGAVVPSPRGHKSFFDEEKIRKFKLLAQEKAPPKLQFGFQPIKKKEKEREKPNTFFGKSTSDYDSFLDSLQAPRVLGRLTPRPRSPAAPRKSKGPSKQDRKSNLDFLGIFDTRQYFYIPNRRSDEEAKTKRSKSSGVLAKIVRLLVGHQ